MKSTEHNIVVDAARMQALTEKGKKYSTSVARIVSACDYGKHEAALAVVSDEKYQIEIRKKLEPLLGSRHVILIGIGGSSLGAEAVYQACAMQTNPTLSVLDSVEPEALDRLEHLVESFSDPTEFAIVIVSKSGNTTETVTNAAHIIEACERHFGNAARSRIVFVGTEGSAFLENGRKQNVQCLTLPEVIGGRYSVFTAAGIAPLMLLKIDTETFLEGARAAVEKQYRDSIIEHATTLATLAEGGIDVVNFFTFNKRLRLLGSWYRQLLAESIGKSMTISGATFSHQLLPVITTSVELHSVAQLYLGGYKHVYTNFVYADTSSEHHAIAEHWTLQHLHSLSNKTPNEVKLAIRTGVFAAYDDQQLPYRKTVLPKITVYELGFFMASQMFEVMVLGHLFGVDVFGQPNVEDYKKHTRACLERGTTL